MRNGFFKVPVAHNEPIKSYAPGTKEREQVLAAYKELYKGGFDIPMYINGEEVRTGDLKEMRPPHDHKHLLGHYHRARKQDIDNAINGALEARKKWAKFSWEQRAAIFLKAAELISGPYRAKINAATMIGQSKTVHQAEIDSACELTDFLRFNVQYMSEIYDNQPLSTTKGVWNYTDYRPLEGFVYAVTPFNFTAISGNLPTSAAMMGNVVVWKPSDAQVFSANVIVEVLKKAGLPDGVINVVYGDAVMITDTILKHPDFAGVHFTGSTAVFQQFWKKNRR